MFKDFQELKNNVEELVSRGILTKDDCAAAMEEIETSLGELQDVDNYEHDVYETDTLVVHTYAVGSDYGLNTLVLVAEK